MKQFTVIKDVKMNQYYGAVGADIMAFLMAMTQQKMEEDAADGTEIKNEYWIDVSRRTLEKQIGHGNMSVSRMLDKLNQQGHIALKKTTKARAASRAKLVRHTSVLSHYETIQRRLERTFAKKRGGTDRATTGSDRSTTIREDVYNSPTSGATHPRFAREAPSVGEIERLRTKLTTCLGQMFLFRERMKASAEDMNISLNTAVEQYKLYKERSSDPDLDVDKLVGLIGQHLAFEETSFIRCPLYLFSLRSDGIWENLTDLQRSELQIYTTPRLLNIADNPEQLYLLKKTFDGKIPLFNEFLPKYSRKPINTEIYEEADRAITTHLNKEWETLTRFGWTEDMNGKIEEITHERYTDKFIVENWELIRDIIERHACNYVR